MTKSYFTLILTALLWQNSLSAKDLSFIQLNPSEEILRKSGMLYTNIDLDFNYKSYCGPDTVKPERVIILTIRRRHPFKRQSSRRKVFYPTTYAYVEIYKTRKLAGRRIKEIKHKSDNSPSLEYSKNCSLGTNFSIDNKVYIFRKGLGETFSISVYHLFYDHLKKRR